MRRSFSPGAVATSALWKSAPVVYCILFFVCFFDHLSTNEVAQYYPGWDVRSTMSRVGVMTDATLLVATHSYRPESTLSSRASVRLPPSCSVLLMDGNAPSLYTAHDAVKKRTNFLLCASLLMLWRSGPFRQLLVVPSRHVTFFLCYDILGPSSWVMWAITVSGIWNTTAGLRKPICYLSACNHS